MKEVKRKIAWVAVSCLMVLSLVLASCAPAVTEEEEVVTPPTEEEEEDVVTPPKEEEVVEEEAEMVKLRLVQRSTIATCRGGGPTGKGTSTSIRSFRASWICRSTALFRRVLMLATRHPTLMMRASLHPVAAC